MKRNSQIVMLACAFLFVLAAAPARADEVAPSGAEFASALQPFYQQDWPKAVEAFQSIVEKDPRDTLAWSYLLLSYIKRNDLRSILYQLEQKATAAEMKDAQTLAQLGFGYLARYTKEPQAAVLDEAQKTLDKALEIDKSNSMAHCTLGLVYYIRRMMPRAKGHFVEALRANPNDLMALERVGDITMIDEKRPKEANELFQQLVQKAPTYPDGYWYVGSSYYDMGDYEKCIEYLKKVVELDPHGVTQGNHAPTLIGKSYLKLKDYANAKEWFLQGLKLNPSSEELRYLLEQSQPPRSTPPEKNTKTKKDGK